LIPYAVHFFCNIDRYQYYFYVLIMFPHSLNFTTGDIAHPAKVSTCVIGTEKSKVIPTPYYLLFILWPVVSLGILSGSQHGSSSSCPSLVLVHRCLYVCVIVIHDGSSLSFVSCTSIFSYLPLPFALYTFPSSSQFSIWLFAVIS